ncbi:MAG: DUF3568 family protein [Nitrospiraceae bacterium]|nr:MAG: DUF3568 family protein [Nitrospiraceae bacterium]
MGGIMKKIGKLLILLYAVSCMYGCAAALIGVGAGAGIVTYKYVDSLLIKEYPLEYAKAWEASNTALKNLQFSISDSVNEGTRGEIDAVKKDGDKVVIRLKDMGQGVTSVSIRVGLLGSRVEAEKVHNAIASAAGI